MPISTQTPEPEDAVLVREAQAGNRAAFDALIARHYSMVYAIALSRLQSVEAAEDLTQEVFLRTYLNLKSLTRGNRYVAWLARMTRNLATDWQRRGITRSNLVQMVPFEEQTAEIPDHSQPDVREAIMDDQEQRLMREALWKLTPIQRELVIMHYQEGMSKKEIAERVGLHPSNVGRQIDKAVAAMRSDVDEALRHSLRPSRSTPRLATRSATVVAGVMLLTPEAKAALVSAAAKTTAVKVHADVAAGAFSLTSLLNSISGSLTAGVSVMGAGKLIAVAVVVGVLGGGVWYHQSRPTTVEMPKAGQSVENKINRDQFLSGIVPENVDKMSIALNASSTYSLVPGRAVDLDFSKVSDKFMDLKEVVMKLNPDGSHSMLIISLEGKTVVQTVADDENEMAEVHLNPAETDRVEFIHLRREGNGISIFYQIHQSPELIQATKDAINSYRQGTIRKTDLAQAVYDQAGKLGLLPPQQERDAYLKGLAQVASYIN